MLSYITTVDPNILVGIVTPIVVGAILLFAWSQDRKKIA